MSLLDKFMTIMFLPLNSISL